MTQLLTALKTYPPLAEYFPGNEDFENHVKELDCCELNYEMVEPCHAVQDRLLGKDFDIKKSTTIQGDFGKFMKTQECGLDRGFRCVKCRGCDECLKGSGYEKISLKQEHEQNLIKQSVRIDEEKGIAVAKLPFKADPTR